MHDSSPKDVPFSDGWPQSSWSAENIPQTYSYQPASQNPLSFHSYTSQPGVTNYQQPFSFDFSHLFPDPAAATATASAYATGAAQFAQQFAQQLATAPPVNAQVDQQNLEKYSQYLDILKNAYGIQLPGELGQSQEVQPQYQLSSFPSSTVTTYQSGAGSYLLTTAQPMQA
ncbi:unnamed protein product, partial [Strongylus vulgaris]